MWVAWLLIVYVSQVRGARTLTVLEDRMPENVLEKATEEMERAINGPFLGFNRVLSGVARGMTTKFGGKWYCFQAQKSLMTSELVKESELYAVYEVDNIVIFLVKLKETLSSEDSLIRQSTSAEENLVVYQNQLSIAANDIIISLARVAIRNQKSFRAIGDYVSRSLVSETKESWGCFVTSREAENHGQGPSSALTEPIGDGFIYFGLGKLKFLVYRAPKKVSPALTMTDYINKARQSLNSYKLHKLSVSENRKKQLVKIGQEAILKKNSLADMAEYCVTEIQRKFRSSYQCSFYVTAFGGLGYRSRGPFMAEYGPITMAIFQSRGM